MVICRQLRPFILFVTIGLVTWVLFLLRATAASSATAFRPVNPEELKMTAEPAAPGAPAIILYREVYRDDNKRREEVYLRIKILTEEGRNYADVEIPFYKDEENVAGIAARTIKPDGSIVDFDGNVVTKSVVKARGLKYLAKTFSLPQVQPGCVIEYYYTIEFHYVFDSHWIVNGKLFTKNAKFYLKPFENLAWRSVWHNLPPGTPPPKKQKDESVQLELSNIPAFQTEDLMPPENELQGRVDFVYAEETPERSPVKYWNDFGKKWNTIVEGVVQKNKTISKAAAEIVAQNDSPEEKLQKIYARVQTLRNTSYEEEKTAQEQRREKEKAPTRLEDVWKHGYGDGTDITWLFLALVRAAGFEAHAVMVPNRARYFFNPSFMEGERLNSGVVLVKLNGKDVWCDPGWAFTPYGLLPWPETGMPGLQLDKNNPTWVNTLTPTSADARTDLHADLALAETGDLEGALTVTFTGLEAARLRVEERNADQAERQSFLEDILKGYIPVPCEVKLKNQPDWKNGALPLVAEFSAKIPAWASAAGHRFIVPVGLFAQHEKHMFDHTERVHPIYVEYPYLDSDDINIQIPAGWRVSSLPQGEQGPRKVVTYALKVEANKQNLHLIRTLAVDFILLEAKYYPALRDYFQHIKTTDDQQIVLEPGAAKASN